MNGGGLTIKYRNIDTEILEHEDDNYSFTGEEWGESEITENIEVLSGVFVELSNRRFILRNNEFVANYAGYKGSALYLSDVFNVRVEDCLFS